MTSRSKRVLGLCYVVVKVSLLVVVEIGIFPLICGWWLDVCSLVSDEQWEFCKLMHNISLINHNYMSLGYCIVIYT